MLERTLQVSSAGVKVRRVKREEKFSVICIEVVVESSEREEIGVLRGVVYMTNSKGPRTEP